MERHLHVSKKTYRFLLVVVEGLSGKKVTVTNLFKKDEGIPWGWCADVCQATKDWAKLIIMTKEAHVFSHGWLAR